MGRADIYMGHPWDPGPKHFGALGKKPPSTVALILFRVSAGLVQDLYSYRAELTEIQRHQRHRTYVP